MQANKGTILNNKISITTLTETDTEEVLEKKNN